MAISTETAIWNLSEYYYSLIEKDTLISKDNKVYRKNAPSLWGRLRNRPIIFLSSMTSDSDKRNEAVRSILIKSCETAIKCFWDIQHSIEAYTACVARMVAGDYVGGDELDSPQKAMDRFHRRWSPLFPRGELENRVKQLFAVYFKAKTGKRHISAKRIHSQLESLYALHPLLTLTTMTNGTVKLHPLLTLSRGCPNLKNYAVKVGLRSFCNYLYQDEFTTADQLREAFTALVHFHNTTLRSSAGYLTEGTVANLSNLLYEFASDQDKERQTILPILKRSSPEYLRWHQRVIKKELPVYCGAEIAQARLGRCLGDWRQLSFYELESSSPKPFLIILSKDPFTLDRALACSGKYSEEWAGVIQMDRIIYQCPKGRYAVLQRTGEGCVSPEATKAVIDLAIKLKNAGESFYDLSAAHLSYVEGEGLYSSVPLMLSDGVADWEKLVVTAAQEDLEMLRDAIKQTKLHKTKAWKMYEAVVASVSAKKRCNVNGLCKLINDSTVAPRAEELLEKLRDGLYSSCDNVCLKYDVTPAEVDFVLRKKIPELHKQYRLGSILPQKFWEELERVTACELDRPLRAGYL